MSENKWKKAMHKNAEPKVDPDLADFDINDDVEERVAITNPSRGEFEEQLNLAEAKANESYEKLLRLQAEFDNVRKRSERDLVQAHKYAAEKIALELLPVVDSLEIGLSQMNDEKLTAYRTGVELTLKQLQGVFDKFAIKAVNPAVGEPFDPAMHQAMTMQESTDAAPNTVLNVLQKGYMLNDRLLRPAMVIVVRAAT